MKIANATDFEKGTAKILEATRLGVGWIAAGMAASAYEHALKYSLSRHQFGKPLASFQITQEKLSRMLAIVEMMLSFLIRVSQLKDQNKATIGQLGRVKGICSLLARDVARLARDIFGGNGILLDNHVMKILLDLESVHTYEGTYEVNMLISGREITGGIAAFK